jgi:hypothetical protein
MRFDGKPLRRRLHPVRPAKAKHFVGELRLLRGWPEMFDHAVAEHWVGKAERLVQTSLREWAYAKRKTPNLKDPSHGPQHCRHGQIQRLRPRKVQAGRLAK